MGKRKVKKMEEVTDIFYYCDICGEEYKLGLACSSGLHRCIVCKRDICIKCSRDNPFYDDWDDSSSAICKDCAEIVEPYKTNLDKLYTKYESDKDKIWEDVRKKAKENIKQKSKL